MNFKRDKEGQSRQQSVTNRKVDILDCVSNVRAMRCEFRYLDDLVRIKYDFPDYSQSNKKYGQRVSHRGAMHAQRTR